VTAEGSHWRCQWHRSTVDVGYSFAMIDVEALWLRLYWTQSPSSGGRCARARAVCLPRRAEPYSFSSECKSPIPIDGGSISTRRWRNGLLPTRHCACRLMPLSRRSQSRCRLADRRHKAKQQWNTRPYRRLHSPRPIADRGRSCSLAHIVSEWVSQLSTYRVPGRCSLARCLRFTIAIQLAIAIVRI